MQDFQSTMNHISVTLISEEEICNIILFNDLIIIKIFYRDIFSTFISINNIPYKIQKWRNKIRFFWLAEMGWNFDN